MGKVMMMGGVPVKGKMSKSSVAQMYAANEIAPKARTVGGNQTAFVGEHGNAVSEFRLPSTSTPSSHDTPLPRRRGQTTQLGIASTPKMRKADQHKKRAAAKRYEADDMDDAGESDTEMNCKGGKKMYAKSATKGKAKDPCAVSLGSKGGTVGGPARAQALPGTVRKKIASKAAAARWGRKTPSKKGDFKKMRGEGAVVAKADKVGTAQAGE